MHSRKPDTTLIVDVSNLLFRVAAVAAYACLLSTWALVAIRTLRGSVGGSLFTPPPAPAAIHKDPK